MLLITYKILNGLAPLYLCQLITKRSLSGYGLRSSNDDALLSYPACLYKTTLGDRAFEHAAPKLWNALPLGIRKASSVDVLNPLIYLD